ncbi:DUF4123 domain-containing protein [Sulfitobacter albidus]|uniref:DUF4123 domain-containing protein n=1 Tax=Sulfitobacter albidus TaxID=2829501 RepID=A0A975JBT1_9RHOB|nr:DUF4123 domain-containing protein [Sulfitobacter albidus]QUJ75371.1 DUF4123 domain-containing protein [Sulfitobacter albidus]
MHADVSENAGFGYPLPTAKELTELEGIRPLDGDALHGPIPEELKNALFGQLTQNQGPKLRTYAVLDATVIFGLAEILHSSGLSHQFLYSGAAGEELSDVGPWLVELSEDNSFARNLLTVGDGPSHYWNKRPGIFFRSYLPIEPIAKHLRHFTRVRIDEERWALFRFWEPKIAAVYFGSLPGRHELFARWCYDSNQRVIERWVMVYCDPVWMLTAPSTTGQHGKVIKIVEEEDRRRFSDVAWLQGVNEIAKSVSQPQWSNASQIDVERTTAIVANWAAGYGISGKRDLGRLVNVALRIGCRFDMDPRFSVWIAALGNMNVPANIRTLALQEKAAEYLHDTSPFAERLKMVERVIAHHIERDSDKFAPLDACRLVDHKLSHDAHFEFCNFVSGRMEMDPKLPPWPEGVICALACLLGACFLTDPSRRVWVTSLRDATDLTDLRMRLKRFRQKEPI